jgi:hypothetical protein
MQMRQLGFQLTLEPSGFVFGFSGFLDMLAQCGGVHENSRVQGIEIGKT